MMEGREQSQNAGVADEGVELAPTAIERFAERDR